MIAQPWVISSGWTVISSLIHVHLIWTDDWSYLSPISKICFYFFSYKTSSSAPPVSHPLFLYVSTLCCAFTSCFHLQSLFQTTFQEKSWGWKIALLPQWLHVSQFEIHRKECLSCDSRPAERERPRARQVRSVTHERAGDGQEYEHGCHRCLMFTPQQQTYRGCRFLPSLLTN